MEFMIAAYTDKGIQKKTNQDSLCVRRAVIPGIGETVMAVVCDGMGGLKKGEVASASAALAFGRWFDEHMKRLHVLCEKDFSIIKKQWAWTLGMLHQELLRYSADNSVQLGTTVAAILTYGDRYLTVNIGDSRIYEQKNSLRRLTEDQSLIAREIAAGRITEEDGRHHPQRNVLLQCLGSGESVTPVFTEGKLQHNSLYLLCSDGLVHELSPMEISEQIQPIDMNSKDDLSGALSKMTEICKGRGENDNITSILIKARESAYKEDESRIKKLLNRLLDNASTEAETVLAETAQIINTGEIVGQNIGKQTR